METEQVLGQEPDWEPVMALAKVQEKAQVPQLARAREPALVREQD